MLHIRICTTAGAVIPEGTCSDSGYFPVALASVYSDALKRMPARSLERFDGASESADYPTQSARSAQRSGTPWPAMANAVGSSTTRLSSTSSAPD